MNEKLIKELSALDDVELATLRDNARSTERAIEINAVLQHRENERMNPTPETEKPSNYTVIHQQQTHAGEDARHLIIVRAWHTPQHLNEDEAPRRFYYEDATPEEIEAYENQVSGEDERAAIFKAAENNGIHFRPETPQSDYSPTGRRYFCRPEITQIHDLIIVSQSSAIDN